MKYVQFFFLITCICSCHSKLKKTGTLSIFPEKDSCYYLQDTTAHKRIEAFRKIRISENTLTDTITFGFAILPPKYIGEFSYLRLNKRKNVLLDPESNEKYWPKTKTFCVKLYKQRPAKGKLVIEYYYE